MKSLEGTGAAAKRKAQKSKPANEELLASSHDEAKELYLLAQQIRTLAPWEWMEETDIFGVQDPVTGEIGFVGIMGALGEYRAIAVYRGVEGLHGWLAFKSALELDPQHPDAELMLLNIPHLTLSFSSSERPEKRDRDLLEGVGLKFTGERPVFRSSRPGYHPWYITREEARLLIHTLSQAIIVAERCANAGNVSVFEEGEEGRFLVRVPRKQGSELVWEDRIQSVSPQRKEIVSLNIETAVLDELRGIDQSQLDMEADLILGPTAVGKRGDRPGVLFMLMLADHDSGFIFGLDPIMAENEIAGICADLPNRIALMLLNAGFLPKRLMVRSDLLFELLKPLTQQLNVQLFYADELPAIEEAADALYEQMGSSR